MITRDLIYRLRLKTQQASVLGESDELILALAEEVRILAALLSRIRSSRRCFCLGPVHTKACEEATAWLKYYGAAMDQSNSKSTRETATPNPSDNA